MTYSIKLNKYLPLLPFIIPILCIWVVNTPLFSEDPASLSMAITFDLLVSTPVLYFLTIRKRTIPNTTVIPAFILGIVIASIILPSEHQYYLSQVKIWILPVVEIGIISYIIITIRRTFKSFKLTGETDFFSAAKAASAKILPKRVAILFATELSVFYYGVFAWKKRRLSLNEYSYHQKTSTQMVLGVFFFIIMIEAIAVHLLLQSWSQVVAWILTCLSIYGCFQILGILKSLSRRPISIKNDAVILRYGIMNEVEVPYNQIKQIAAFTTTVEKSDGYVHLSPFKDMEGHNILIEVENEMELNGFYGVKKSFEKLLIYTDEPERFLKKMEAVRNPARVYYC
ncbi:hypothetical protein AAOE16_00635 [Ekhidna sp. MALMAid0563]|uniref:hypothetical protein n=1 Tax=Ekhidna sp. MALMAid0563 TaxID=3143937 RepID=UPI0032DEFF04